MRVAVLGAGAMGSLFGARLARAGHEVSLIDADSDHVSAINRYGLKLVEPGVPEQTLHVGASTRSDEIQAAEVVVVFTKAHQVARALRSAALLANRAAAVVILSNGLDCAASAAEWLPSGRALHGASSSGAILDGPGRVRYTVEGITVIGPYPRGSRPPTITASFVDALTAAGLETKFEPDPEAWMWTKLLINIGFNAATALTRLRNGEFVSDAGGRAIVEAALREALEVATAKGVRIAYKDPIQAVVGLGLSSIAPNQSSMLQDVLRARPTEVEFLNGAIVREGAALGVPTPVNETLYRLVKAIDAHVEQVPSESSPSSGADDLGSSVGIGS